MFLFIYNLSNFIFSIFLLFLYLFLWSVLFMLAWFLSLLLLSFIKILFFFCFTKHNLWRFFWALNIDKFKGIKVFSAVLIFSFIFSFCFCFLKLEFIIFLLPDFFLKVNDDKSIFFIMLFIFKLFNLFLCSFSCDFGFAFEFIWLLLILLFIELFLLYFDFDKKLYKFFFSIL